MNTNTALCCEAARSPKKKKKQGRQFIQSAKRGRYLAAVSSEQKAGWDWGMTSWGRGRFLLGQSLASICLLLRRHLFC